MIVRRAAPCHTSYNIIHIVAASLLYSQFASREKRLLVQQWRQIARGGVCARCAVRTRVKNQQKTRCALACIEKGMKVFSNAEEQDRAFS